MASLGPPVVVKKEQTTIPRCFAELQASGSMQPPPRGDLVTDDHKKAVKERLNEFAKALRRADSPTRERWAELKKRKRTDQERTAFVDDLVERVAMKPAAVTVTRAMTKTES